MRLRLGALALAAILPLAGCRDDGAMTVVILQDGTTDNFPGGTIAQNNLADDGRALSQNNQSVVDVKCYMNGSRGTGMILFSTTDNVAMTSHIYATYYNGMSLTPPVELRAADQDFTVAVTNLFETNVLFLNTAGNPDPEAAARNGDAIILYKRTDFASGALVGNNGGVDGLNVALFASYFDLTNVANPAARFGFDSANGLGVRVDGAIADNTFQDAAGENVVRHGIISDGYRARCFFTGDDKANFADNGDAVTFNPVALWTQTDLGANDAGGLPDDTRLFYRVFDITTDASGVDLLAQGEIPFAPAGMPTREVGPANRDQTRPLGGAFVTYDNTLVMMQQDDDTAGGGFTLTDQTLVLNRIDPTPADPANPFEATGTAITPGANGVGVPQDQGGTEIMEQHLDRLHPNGIFGPDDGVGGALLFFFTAGSSSATDAPDLFVAQFNPFEVSGMFETFDPAVDRAQISGDIGLEGLDFATAAANQGSNKHLERLARNKSYLLTSYREGMLGMAAVLNAASVVPTATSPVADLPALAANVSPAVTVSDNGNPQDVTAYQWQDELDGDNVQSTQKRANHSDCPQQSQVNTMFLLFEQSDPVTDFDQLFARAVVFAGAGTAPTLNAAVEIPGGNAGDFEDGELEGAFPGPTEAGARRFAVPVFGTDNGLDGGGNQRLIVFYVRDQDTTGGTTMDDVHLFAAEADSGVLGETLQIDSGDPARDVTGFVVKTVATDRFSGGDDAFAGNQVHVIFSEARTNATSSIATRSRRLSKAVRLSNPGVALAGEIFPTVGTPPLLVDFDVNASSTLIPVNFALPGTAPQHAGETLAVYFFQSGNLYYNEFNIASWITTGGASSPQVVDNDGMPPSNAMQILVGGRRADVICPVVDFNCNDLSGALILFARTEADGDVRLFARRHN